MADRQHRLAAGLEMFDVADQFCLALARIQQRLQPLLAFAQAAARGDPRRREQQVEGKEDRDCRSCLGRAPPAGRRNPACRLRSSATISPSIMPSGSLAGLLGDCRETCRSSPALARLQAPRRSRRAADAIAVELDLVAPSRAARRTLTDSQSCGGTKSGMAETCFAFAGATVAALAFALGASAGRAALGSQTASALVLAPFASMNGLAPCPCRRRSPPSCGPRRRSDLPRGCIALASAGEFITMLDQEPVGALAALAVAFIRTRTQLPCSRRHRVNLRSPFGKAASAIIALGLPIAAVPELHGAAAILALGNRAFEIAVVERMILDLDRQAFVRGSSEGPR